MFRIGEFSKIAQVPDSVLRYYDQIGLFKPATIDQWTGYRYYSAKQLPRLHRILALKELGMSLEQITRLVDEAVSTAEIRGMLTLKKAQVEQNLQAEVVRLRTIEARLEQIDTAAQAAFAQAQGASEAVLHAIRAGESPDDPRLAALSAFTYQVASNGGQVSAEDMETFLTAGFTPEQLLEVLVGVSQAGLASLVHHMSEAPIDEGFQAWASVPAA